MSPLCWRGLLFTGCCWWFVWCLDVRGSWIVKTLQVRPCRLHAAIHGRIGFTSSHPVRLASSAWVATLFWGDKGRLCRPAVACSLADYAKPASHWRQQLGKAEPSLHPLKADSGRVGPKSGI